MAHATYADWDEDDAFASRRERPARRARRRRLPWLRMILASGLIVSGLVYHAQRQDPAKPAAAPQPVPNAVLIAPEPVWRAISPLPAHYALERSSGLVSPEARRHANGGREDTLTVSAFGQPGHARIVLAQGVAEPTRSFYVDVVRRAAEAGLAVARNSQSRTVATKFGPVEAAAATLAGTVEQPCQTFRFTDADAGFGAIGWLCGADSHPVDDAQLACFIDGIGAAVSASPSLKALFARAERTRTEACGPASRTASVAVKAPPRP